MPLWCGYNPCDFWYLVLGFEYLKIAHMMNTAAKKTSSFSLSSLDPALLVIV